MVLVFSPWKIFSQDQEQPNLKTWLSQQDKKNQEQRFISHQQDYPITFGLEVEFDVERYPEILDFYKPIRLNPQNPQDVYQPTDKEWQKLSRKEKLALFRYHHFKKQLIHGKLYSRWENPEDQTKDFIRYEKIKHFKSDDPERRIFYNYLKPTLTVEARGNVEVNGHIFEHLQDVKIFFYLLQKFIGQGDTQTHVVFPNKKLNNLFGLTLWEHDRSFIHRLNQEFEEFIQDSRFLPAVQANSDWDGLLSHTRKEQIQHVETLIKNDQFPKSESSRIYRTGIPAINRVAYPENLLGFEMRQEDNPSENTRPYLGSYDRLISSMDRVSTILENEGDFSSFAAYESIELPYDLNQYEPAKTHGFNEQHAREKNQQFLIKRIEQLKLSPFAEIALQAKKLEAHFLPHLPIWDKLEKYCRNTFSGRSTLHAFFHAFRDWDYYPDFLKLPAEKQQMIRYQLHQATINFLQKILNYTEKNEWDSLFSAMRVAYAQWGYESHLRDMFTDERIAITPATKMLFLPKHQEIAEAAKRGDLATIKKFLAQGISIDAQDREGMTPLM